MKNNKNLKVRKTLFILFLSLEATFFTANIINIEELYVKIDVSVTVNNTTY